MLKTYRSHLTICFVLFFFAGYTQNQAKVDSIQNLLDRGQLTESQKLAAYYNLSVYSSSPEEELKYGNTLLDLAKESDNIEFVIKANLRIGVAYRLMGNLATALEFLFESANRASEDEDYKVLLVDIYQEISTCYTQNGDSDNALLYGSKTIEVLRTTGKRQRLALTLLNIGYDYYLMGKYDSAMNYYNESEPILQEIEMTLGIAYIIGNRALVNWKKGDSDRAKTDLNEALAMLEPLGDQFGMADYYNQLGNIYWEEENTKEAIFHTTKGLTIAEEEGLKEQVRDASYILFMHYEKIGDYKKALEYQTKYQANKDSISNLETTQRIADLRTEFEVGQKQAEVDLLLEQKRSNQIIIVTGGVILVIVLCLAVVIYSFLKTKIKLNKQLEEQKEALIALNNTKDKFFSIISHDLRGPVNNISGLISVTRYSIEDNNPDEMKDMIDKMETSANRLVKLLDNLLQWALQQRGHFPYEPENLSVKNLLDEASEMFGDMASAKNIAVDIQVEKDFTLFVDENTASTIVRNLLNNAIKFTPVGGNVKVQAEKDGSTNYGILRFVDDGVGIPRNKLDKLFTLDEKITTKGTSGESGLGLGLQLVYDFVQLNKGEIQVDSKEAEGTTFTVKLPTSSNLS